MRARVFHARQRRARAHLDETRTRPRALARKLKRRLGMKKLQRLGSIGFTALVLSACGSNDVRDDNDNGAVSDDPLDDTAAAPSWRGCGTALDRNVHCAEIAVPVDYDDPAGETIEIAINRVDADPTVPYKGVLFFNPGGPGGSGKDAVKSLANVGFFDAYAPGYDIVGFDPRGVGDSGEQGCGPAPARSMQAMQTTDADVEPSMADYVAAMKVAGGRCADAWGPLFQKLGSNQVVRDMDRLRRSLGQAKLNYLGISYGTRLGALYAHAYPESAGFIALDASVPPDLDFVSLVRDGFYQTLALQDLFFQDCDAGVLDCPPDARQLFDAMIAVADELGVRDSIASYWSSSLAFPDTREALPGMLELQATEPSSDWLLDYAANPDIFGVAEVANISVNCADQTTPPPSIETVEALFSELSEKNELFASKAYAAATCTGWPVTRDPIPTPTAFDAPPLLVLGGAHDLLTPIEEARAMTDALGNATLLTSNHYGHSATMYGGECVLDAVRAFFDNGALPEAGATCD